ncbi:hypothetical protein [Devosia sp. DBB001]|nr:hypothetical protein [Devosia sp. DBB001]
MTNQAEFLPEIIAEIAGVAGFDAAWTIAVAKGGQQVFIPAIASPDHWLAQLVGLDAATRICAHFSTRSSGDKILIPMASGARRRKAWADALASDKSANEIAATLGVHRRTVFRHKSRTNDDQGELF